MNGNLVAALDRRVKSVVSDNSLSVLQVFDAAVLVSLHCGSSSDGVVRLVVQDGEYETYGVEACEDVLSGILAKSGPLDFVTKKLFLYFLFVKRV